VLSELPSCSTGSSQHKLKLDSKTFPTARGYRPPPSAMSLFSTESRPESAVRCHVEGSLPSLLPESERVGLGAGPEERDLQRPLVNRVVLAHELVEAAVPEQAVSVLVDVHAV
jgi:hypothetical protein